MDETMKMTSAQREYLSRQKKHRQIVTLCRFFLLILLLSLWELGAFTGVIDSFIFSSPSRVAGAFSCTRG